MQAYITEKRFGGIDSIMKKIWHHQFQYKEGERMKIPSSTIQIGISIGGPHRKSLHILGYEIVEKLIDENIIGQKISSICITNEQKQHKSRIGIIVKREEEK